MVLIRGITGWQRLTGVDSKYYMALRQKRGVGVGDGRQRCPVILRIKALAQPKGQGQGMADAL
jgi:hypothetical protein